MKHVSVLLQPSIEGLQIKQGGIFVDATLGAGGHSKYVCTLFGPDVAIVGIDQDKNAIKYVEDALSKENCFFRLTQGNFRNIDTLLDELSVDGVDYILFDLGWNSEQMLSSGRGFSFQVNDPLLMTYRDSLENDELTAAFILNNWSEETIATIIYGYGDERYSRRIAHAIVEARKIKSIETTFDLVDIVKNATPYSYHHRKIHPATRTFQALRMAVNDEIEALREALRKSFERLNKGGRMAVISFHSIEDRIVKRMFREWCQKEYAYCEKLIKPSLAEIKENPRARSAKLRIIEKK